MRQKALLSFGLIFGCFTATAMAATFSGSSDLVTISDLPANTLSIRVTGPARFVMETEQNYIYAEDGSLLLDGQYRYEITAAIDLPATNGFKNSLNNGRNIEQSVGTGQASKVVESGNFRIQSGKVLKVTEAKE